MATYTASTSKHATLSAGDVDTITFTGVKAGFRIQNRSTTHPLFYTWSASTPLTPSAAGTVDGSYRIEPGMADTRIALNKGVVLKITSAGAAPYSAETWTA